MKRITLLIAALAIASLFLDRRTDIMGFDVAHQERPPRYSSGVLSIHNGGAGAPGVVTITTTSTSTPTWVSVPTINP